MTRPDTHTWKLTEHLSGTCRADLAEMKMPVMEWSCLRRRLWVLIAVTCETDVSIMPSWRRRKEKRKLHTKIETKGPKLWCGGWGADGFTWPPFNITSSPFLEILFFCEEFYLQTDDDSQFRFHCYLYPKQTCQLDGFINSYLLSERTPCQLPMFTDRYPKLSCLAKTLQEKRYI